jgi:hypothetical protein
VTQPGDRLQLPREPRRRRRVRRELGADELHGTRPLQEPVIGEPHVAHTAFAELMLERVLAHPLGAPLGLERPPLEGRGVGGGEHRESPPNPVVGPVRCAFIAGRDREAQKRTEAHEPQEEEMNDDQPGAEEPTEFLVKNTARRRGTGDGSRLECGRRRLIGMRNAGERNCPGVGPEQCLDPLAKSRCTGAGAVQLRRALPGRPAVEGG